ncbi:hypothetical protein [Streptomyces erythrochromogenes]|uniref:hypothetical protein n=1 Tax=Streptomyces erythrochromogenes TaxID=285574 RepID=UPI00380FB94B
MLVDLGTGTSASFELESAGDTPPAERTATAEPEYRPHSQGCGMSGIEPSVTELRPVTGRGVCVLRAGRP